MSIQHVLDDLRLNRFAITSHAVQRMSERGVMRKDIRSVGDSCSSWAVQANGRFKIKGRDSEGDDLTVICVYDGETLVVTLF